MESTRENFQLCHTRRLDAYLGQQFDIPADHSDPVDETIAQNQAKIHLV